MRAQDGVGMQAQDEGSKLGRDLVGRYDLFLLDAYGVLLTSAGALPYAKEFIAALNENKTPYYIVTNDASRLPERACAFYQQEQLAIPLARVLTAGLVIRPALQALIETGVVPHQPRCCVLGTSDTHEYVRRAGGEPVPISDNAEFDALIVGDDSGFETLPTLNALLSSMNRMIHLGKPFRLMLANPDLLYPRGEKRFGFTSGTIAKVLEIGLQQLHPEQSWSFEVLGKPSALIYEMGIAKAESELGRRIDRNRVVMFGDQLHTDVRGAIAAGIESGLLLTGITRAYAKASPSAQLPWIPTHVLESL